MAEAGGNHEIIVVDDASSDDTVAWMQHEYPQIKLLALPKNLRFAGANNAAARIATGDILLFLNNDMLVEPDFLPPLLAPFEDDDVFAVTAYIQMAPRLVEGSLVCETGLVRGRSENGFLVLQHDKPESGDPIPVIYAGGGSSAWRKDRFLALGGFDTLFRPFYSEDLDVSYQGQKHGWRVLFQPQSRMEHKHRQTNNPKHFPAWYVERMFLKNALLFLWKAQTDEDVVRADFRMLWRMLMRPRLHPALGKAFLRATWQLPELLAHRARSRAGIARTDREVVARAAGAPRVRTAEGGTLPYRSAGTGKRVLVLGFAPMPFEPERRLSALCHRTWHVTQALLEDGHEVVLAANRMAGAYEDEENRPPILRFTGEHFAYYSMQHAAFEGSDALQRLCEEFKPEAVVAVHSYCAWIASKLGTEAPLWADLNGYGMAEAQARAAQVHDDAAMEEAWRWEKASLERADAVSVVSNRQKYAAIGELAALGRLSGRNYGEDLVHYMPNAIEPTPYRHQKTVLRGRLAGDSDFVVLWSGGYNTWTDVDTLFAGLVAAMREEPRLRFVSIGGAIPGRDEQTLYHFRELIEASEFADRFVFTGWVPTEEMPNYYFESDVGLNIDRASYEMLLGCRYRIMDMLRAGLPVVTSLGTEISHIVRNEKLGATFTPGSAEELAQVLVEMARDESARRRCATRAKEWVFKHRTVEQVMAPLRRWMQAPARAEVRARQMGVNHVWQPRTWLGRFARTWETVGSRALLRGAAKGVVRGSADAAGKAMVLRRGAVPWGLEAAHPPHRALVVRAGALELTRDLMAHTREAFPEIEITVLTPENLAEETRFELDAPVITAPGAGLVSYRITREAVARTAEAWLRYGIRGGGRESARGVAGVAAPREEGGGAGGRRGAYVFAGAVQAAAQPGDGRGATAAELGTERAGGRGVGQPEDRGGAVAVAASGADVSGRPAVFLDRDGTLVREVDYLREVSELRLLPGAAEAVRKLNEAGFAVALLTNQSGLARGYLTEAKFQEIQETLVGRLARRGAHLDGMYYCPHHPRATVPEYRRECDCRKPAAGMLVRAAAEMRLDLARSYAVGDRARDLVPGHETGDAGRCWC